MMVTMPAICAISLVISDRQKENLKGPVKSVREYLLSKQKYYDADTVALYKKLGKELPKYQKELFTDTRFDRQGRKTYEYDAVFERTNKYVYGVDGSMPPTAAAAGMRLCRTATAFRRREKPSTATMT